MKPSKDIKKNFVAIMTDNREGRDKFLEDLLSSFLPYTDLSEWNLMVFCDGHSKSIEKICDKYEIHRCFTDSIIGCGHHVNRIWKSSQIYSYEYTLFLEGDWVLLHDRIPDNLGKDWLNYYKRVLDVHPEYSDILLRFYRCPMEYRQYCGFEFFGKNKMLCDMDELYKPGKLNLLPVTGVFYTNNPHLRRNKDYMDVLPLDVEHIETKDSEHWGEAEWSAERRMFAKKQFVLTPGLFIHNECINYEENPKSLAIDCDYQHNTKCVYGFSLKQSEWCEVCKGCKLTKDILENEKRFLEKLRTES